jgi:hypothetical protein
MRQSSRIQENMQDPGVKYIVARDQDTKKTASFAQWQLPKIDGQDKEDAEMSESEMVCGLCVGSISLAGLQR